MLTLDNNNRTTTSANAVLLLSARGLFTVPQQIQGFASDDMIASDVLSNIEAAMGADGRLSAGFTPAPTMMTVTLQADSQSNDFFEQIVEAQQSAREAYILDGTYVLKSVERKYTLTRGFLMSAPKFSSARRVLQPRAYQIQWQDVLPART